MSQRLYIESISRKNYQKVRLDLKKSLKEVSEQASKKHTKNKKKYQDLC